MNNCNILHILDWGQVLLSSRQSSAWTFFSYLISSNSYLQSACMDPFQFRFQAEYLIPASSQPTLCFCLPRIYHCNNCHVIQMCQQMPPFDIFKAASSGVLLIPPWVNNNCNCNKVPPEKSMYKKWGYYFSPYMTPSQQVNDLLQNQQQYAEKLSHMMWMYGLWTCNNL